MKTFAEKILVIFFIARHSGTAEQNDFSNGFPF